MTRQIAVLFICGIEIETLHLHFRMRRSALRRIIHREISAMVEEG